MSAAPPSQPTTTTTTTMASREVPVLDESLVSINESLASIARSHARILDRHDLAAHVDAKFVELVEIAKNANC